MQNELVDEVARTIHRQHAKEMFGEFKKWEKISSNERSTWRLIARTAISLVEKRPAKAASK